MPFPSSFLLYIKNAQKVVGVSYKLGSASCKMLGISIRHTVHSWVFNVSTLLLEEKVPFPNELLQREGVLFSYKIYGDMQGS